MGGMVVMAGLSMASSIKEGLAAEGAYKIQAKQAGLEAKSEELDRRRELQDALAMQAVITGASGRAAGEGSVMAIQKEDRRRASEDIEMIKAGGKARQTSLIGAGKLAKGAAITKGLLSSAQTLYSAKQVK